MNNKLNDNKAVKESTRQPYMDTAWFAGLMDEVRRSSKTAVAAKLGVHRTTISCVCGGVGEYGNGRASTQRIELAYRRAYEQLICPHTQAQVGSVHCRTTALCDAPTHNPIRMAQWQACQQCTYKPAEVVVIKSADPVPAPRKNGPVTLIGSQGKATSHTEAHQEGWDCTGGPHDNPYPIEDPRSDCWDLGFKERRNLFRKMYAKTQASSVDKVTRPLPEVGAPQIAGEGDKA